MREKKIGVFDPEGKHNNPLTGKPYQNLYADGEHNGVPTTYNYFAEGVYKNPLLKDIEHSYDILDKLRNHQVLVIQSATGTGKTVVLPKLAAHLMDYKKQVVVTVPKQALAASSSNYCAKCMDVVLGEEVGYAHKDSTIVETVTTEEGEMEITRKSHDEKNTKVLFVTDGWLAKRVSKNLTLKEYGVIMIDEVHERNSAIDLVLLYLREALILNSELKVIVTSATLDIDFFANYFREKGITVATKTVSGKPMHHIEPIFNDIKITGTNIVKEVVKAYDKYLNKKNVKEDCIIFVNSGTNAKKIKEELTKLNKKIYIIIATSHTNKMDEDLEKKAAENPKTDPFLKELYEKEGYDRRVIIATDVWESSVTLPLLKYVIEPGLAFVSDYDGKRMSYSLKNKQIAQGQVLQRKGRVGRTSPGTCIYLYSKKAFDKLKASKNPGIKTEDFTKFLIDWWTREGLETLGDVLRFTLNLISPPDKDAVKNGLKALYTLDFTTGNDSRNDELTELGYFLGSKNWLINDDVRYAKSLYYANYYNCKKEVTVILSLLHLQRGISEIFLECKNQNDKEECGKRLDRYRNEWGDMFAGLKAFLSYQDYNAVHYDVENWAKRNYLNLNKLKEVETTYKKLIKKRYPLDLFENKEKIKFESLADRILYCLLKGFLINLAVKKGRHYQNLFPIKKSKTSPADIIKISSKKTLNFANKESKYIIYNKLQEFDVDCVFTDTLGIPENIVNLLTDFEKEMLDLK